MLDKLSHSAFSPLVGEVFRIETDGAAMDGTLAECRALGRRPSGPGQREPFSLIFRGPSGPAWPQGIYRLRHAALGEFELFLVPVGPDREGMRYEAIFT